MHDYTDVAWAIVLSYGVAFAASLLARSRTALASEKRFWLLVAVGLLALGFNKELDLQTTLTQIARTLARQDNWYQERRIVQLWFLLVLGLAGLATALVLGTYVRKLTSPAKGAAVGAFVLVLFVLIRAASFHHLDQWLQVDVLGLRRGWAFELFGIWIIVASAAAVAMRNPLVAGHDKA